ncbi:MAG: SDR family NAD(P)-dependent oxidoreductase [Bradymonadaceae bacterium]
MAAGAYAAWQSYRYRNYLKGKTAVVTGGTRGLGYLVARELGHRGCRVAICGRDVNELSSARRALEEDDITAESIQCDVTEVEDVRRLVDETREQFGAIDVLVNNAGIMRVGSIESMEVNDFQESMDTMFWGVFHPTWEVLPEMFARGEGHIVNITSIGGKVSVPHLLPYCAAKFAAVGFSEGLRAEMEGTGVSVTTIAPGLMRTGSFKQAEFKGQRQKEYTWFSLASSLPGIAMDAESAAREVVDATVRGQAERILTFPAKVLNAIHGIAPGAVANMLGFVDRNLLPAPASAETGRRQGKNVEGRMDETKQQWLERATTLGQRAARRYQT